MRLAHRVGHITGGGSDGWDIYYRTRAMIAAGERVLNLTIGEPDRKTDPAILSAMHAAAMAGHTGYSFGPGLPELRRAIAERVAERTGVPTGPENVVVTAGGQSALFAAHMVTLDQGDRALYCDPYYATYPGTIRATGAIDVAVPTRPEDDFQPRADAISARASGARTLLINTPNNPTGVTYPRATLDAIGRVASDHDLWLISDEVYDTQTWQGDHLSARAVPGLAERCIVIGSLSKSHAMTGSRLGWLVAPVTVAEAAATLATNTTYGVPAFIQMAALTALALGTEFETAIAEPFRRRRGLALARLAGANGLRPVPSAGGMYLMLDIRATGLTGTDFAARLLEDERIAVMPGESFGQMAAGHVRVAMTIADADFADAIDRLAGFAARISPPSG